MDNVAGVVLASQTVADFFYLIGREIGHAAHPNAEAPEWRHRGEACKHAIATKNLLRRFAADEEDVKGSVIVEELYTTGGVIGQREFAVVGGMEECSIHTTGKIEGDILIATTVVYALSVLVFHLESLSAEVHLAETLTCADKALAGLAAEGDGGALRCVCRCATATYCTETKGQGIVAGRREVIIAEGDGL